MGPDPSARHCVVKTLNFQAFADSHIFNNEFLSKVQCGAYIDTAIQRLEEL